MQGLELDWACVTWDGDFCYRDAGWEHWSFVGDRWKKIHKPERQTYLKNAYRVLLTRARQGGRRLRIGTRRGHIAHP